jgi:hypothetical protein
MKAKELDKKIDKGENISALTELCRKCGIVDDE